MDMGLCDLWDPDKAARDIGSVVLLAAVVVVVVVAAASLTIIVRRLLYLSIYLSIRCTDVSQLVV